MLVTHLTEKYHSKSNHPYLFISLPLRHDSSYVALSGKSSPPTLVDCCCVGVGVDADPHLISQSCRRGSVGIWARFSTFLNYCNSNKPHHCIPYLLRHDPGYVAQLSQDQVHPHLILLSAVSWWMQVHPMCLTVVERALRMYGLGLTIVLYHSMTNITCHDTP